jgi:hypothetical protein
METGSVSETSSYWLLLRGGIVQGVPSTAAIFWSIVRPSHSWFIQQSSMVAAETPSNEAGSW